MRKIVNFFGEIIRNVIMGVSTYLVTLLIMLVGILLVFILFWLILRLYDGNWPK